MENTSEKDAARRKWQLSQRRSRAHGGRAAGSRGGGRGGGAQQQQRRSATTTVVAARGDGDDDSDDDDSGGSPTTSTTLPSRSQGADYAALLAEADALYGQAHRRHRALSGAWDDADDDSGGGGGSGASAALLLEEQGLAPAGAALLRALGLGNALPGGVIGDEDAAERAAAQAAAEAERWLMALDAPALAAVLRAGLPVAAVVGLGGRSARLGYVDGLLAEEEEEEEEGVKGAVERPTAKVAPAQPPAVAPAAAGRRTADLEDLEGEMDALLRKPAPQKPAAAPAPAAAAAHALPPPPAQPPPPAPPPLPPQAKNKPPADDLTLDEWLDGM